MKEIVILVIEDNALNMKLLRALLKTRTYVIVEALDGLSGLEMARKHKPDIILMDIQLPDINGFQVTRIIKKEDELKHIPVIALTSYAMKTDEREAYMAGCSGYITKPINTRTFLAELDKFLHHHEAGDEHPITQSV
jgi:CheY-like chemotaxis protein